MGARAGTRATNAREEKTTLDNCTARELVKLACASLAVDSLPQLAKRLGISAHIPQRWHRDNTMTKVSRAFLKLHIERVSH